jgi:nitrogen fixation NifU-like protein
MKGMEVMKDTKAYIEWIIRCIKSGFLEVEPNNDYWHVGSIENPDGYGKINGICGDTMEICVRISNDTITDASFLTDGCMSSQLCGSAATFLAKGERLIDALDISAADIIHLLKYFEGVEVHCAILSVSTLYRAIAEYLLKQQQYLLEQEIEACSKS